MRRWAPAARIAFWVMLGGATACRRDGEPRPAVDAQPAEPDTAVAVDPELAEASRYAERVARTLKCFDRELQARAAKDARLEAYRRNTFTEIFIWGAVVRDPAWVDESDAALCARVVDEYQRLFVSVAPRRPTGEAKVAEEQGLMLPTIDSQPKFLRESRNPIAAHLLDHEEVTRAALLEATGGREHRFIDVVVYGGAASEIQRWSDPRFQALTADHEPAARASESATYQEVFSGRTVAFLTDFALQARAGNFSMAALDLGVACHSIQDLAFHRGITPRQLAGLQFFAKKDPSGLEPAEARRTAQRFTHDLVAIARTTIGPATWKRLLGWTPPANLDPSHASKSLFRDEAPIPWLSFAYLTRHWTAHLVYRRSPERRSELEEGPNGLIRWDPAVVFERIRVGIAGNGLAEPAPARP